MSKRKSKNADLESKRGVFFKIGLVVTLSMVLIAFSITTTVYGSRLNYLSSANFLESEEAPLFKIEKVQQQEKKTFSKPIPDFVPEVIKEIEGEVEPEDEFKLPFDLEDLTVGDKEVDGDPAELLPYGRVEILPYFIDCENVLNREEQRLCSEGKLRNLLVSKIQYPRDLVGVISGTVWTSFVINEFGEIEDVKIERGLHKRIDEQVLQSFKNVPAMVPASQQGKKVRVMYSMPFKFETK